MPPIDGVSVLAALIAQEIATRRRAHQTGKPPVESRVAPSSPAEDRLKLQQRIARRIGTIDAHDPERDSKGLKVFLEAVFLEEFGAELVEDPAFHDLLARVHTSMMKTPTLAEPVRKAMSDLLGAMGKSIGTP